jgi:hypothetical protein
MNISTKMTFLRHFSSFIDHISTLEKSGEYSKIEC